MHPRRRLLLAAALAAPAVLRAGRGGAGSGTEGEGGARLLRIGHHFPDSSNDQGDFRDRLVRRFAADVTARTNGTLTFEIYPAATLMKPAAQFSGLRRGALDVTLCPLSFGAGEVPEAAIGAVPCMVNNDRQAAAWKAAPAGRRLDALLRQRGVRILTWVWLPCAIPARNAIVVTPGDVFGLRVRSGSKPVADTLKAAGARPSPLLSEAAAVALRNEKLDAAIVSSTSLLSFKTQDGATSVTTARQAACCYTLQPLMASEQMIDSLSDAQQKAMTDAGAALDDFAAQSARADADKVAGVFADSGLTVRDMDAEAFGRWVALAATTGWKTYAAGSSTCAELLRLAFAVPA